MAKIVLDPTNPMKDGLSPAASKAKQGRDMRRSATSADDARKIILTAIQKGWSIDDACRAAQKSRSAYQYYRDNFPDWRDRVDVAMAQRKNEINVNREQIPDFPDFCEEYLDTKMYWHQLQWFDMLEGREPRDLHPRQRYVQGDPDMMLINTPPEHAKSTTITINYITWRICQDPNIRILIVSRTQDAAAKFLFSIKERLSDNPAYSQLQADFGPPGGFASGDTWSATRIRVNGAESGEHSYTCQAVGIGGQIYGTRADLIVVDDCVDHTNHQQFPAQISWIQNQVGTRVADAGGRIAVVGTRLESVDLYSELVKDHYYIEGGSPWTYLTQPAVLEYAQDPKDWKTLWPETNRSPVSVQGKKASEIERTDEQRETGSWPMWHGAALQRKRKKMSARNWSMVYMQDQVSDDSIFKMEAVQGCVDKARYPGRMFDGLSDHRKHGMEGLYTVAGLDPAASGCTAIVVLGMDRQSGVRWLLEVVNERAMPPHRMREEMKRLTERYSIAEWRVEKNAYQASIVQDRDVREMLISRGALINPHHTDSKKWDTDFGVASMAPLFEGWQEGRNLIRLPSQTQSEPMRQFIEELCAWFPETKGLTDLVMALWFAEIRCRELASTHFDDNHLPTSEYASLRDTEGQFSIDIDFAVQQQLADSSWDGSLSSWGFN